MKPVTAPHDSAHTHVQGRSEYVDDRPELPGELHVGLVVSARAHATITKIDLSAAQAVPGFAGAYSAKDVAHNVWGTIFPDQPLLADTEVRYVGETILVVAAETRSALAKILRAVRITYRDLPAVLSIDEALRAQAFIGPERTIARGEVATALASAPHRLSGTIKIRGAEHFYLESQVALSYPLENGGIEVHSSSQHPTEVQHVVSHGLGLASNQVVCIVKRMGGAFGGKESQAAPIAAYAALVTQKTGRPARLLLTKDEDMLVTGKRNPFENRYDVGFDADGRIVALDAKLYSDGGAYADLSTSIMERAMLHIDNAYYLPNVRVTGQVCRTHIHPHTAFRGFGGPKGILTIERVIEEIAHKLGKDPLDVRLANLYRDGRDVTPYGQRVENNCLPALFERLERSSDYRARRRAIATHNRDVRSAGLSEPLRGLSLTPVKFGISFTTKFLNQGNALVNVYRDGSVQVSTGATEMGQGVYSRIAALVADELGVPLGTVRVMPTSTEKNANTSPTAASSGTDINGSAAVQACQRIKARLADVARELFRRSPDRWPRHTAVPATEPEITTAPGTNGSMFESTTFDDVLFENGEVILRADPTKRLAFEGLCNEAYLSRVSLCEYAHYRIPGLSFNKVSGQGQAFLYFTQGVAATEVSIDPLTGEVKTLRTDILMDLGRPVNRALDEGQVSGAYVQGLGWMLTERLVYNEQGRLLTVGPSTYKIPSVHDAPRDFRIDLLANDGNAANVRGTKAVGEPPLMLAISAWTAVHNAVLAANEAAFPQLEVPATSEDVLKALWPEAYAELS